jgi:hypothetical protein
MAMTEKVKHITETKAIETLRYATKMAYTEALLSYSKGDLKRSALSELAIYAIRQFSMTTSMINDNVGVYRAHGISPMTKTEYMTIGESIITLYEEDQNVKTDLWKHLTSIASRIPTA